jgi:hypothetical protein
MNRPRWYDRIAHWIVCYVLPRHPMFDRIELWLLPYAGRYAYYVEPDIEPYRGDDGAVS